MHRHFGMMIGVGVGVVVGGALGGVTGHIVDRRRHRVPALSKDADEKIDDISPIAQTGKFTVFGTNTFYLNESSEFYALLDRFEAYLQEPDHKKMFQSVVERIDHIVGLDQLITSGEPHSKAAIPSIAHKHLDTAQKTLKHLIEVADTHRKSQTKRASMEEIQANVSKMMDDYVTQMHAIVALNQ